MASSLKVIGFPPVFGESYRSHVSLFEPHLITAMSTDMTLFRHLKSVWIVSIKTSLSNWIIKILFYRMIMELVFYFHVDLLRVILKYLSWWSPWFQSGLPCIYSRICSTLRMNLRIMTFYILVMINNVHLFQWLWKFFRIST